ncbi:MAG: T9SS type A sorting domain-containing protein [Bacteroidota bacterium]
MKIRNLFISLVLLAGLIVLTSPATFAAGPWYVDAAIGNDAYDGTQAALGAGLVGPKLTISAMLASSFVVNGDVINIAGNTYNETVVLTKRVQLVGTGSAVTIQNLTLNTASTSSTAIGSTTGGINQIINVSGTLYLQSGKYTPALAKLNLLANAIEQIAVGDGGTTSGFLTNPPTASGVYDMVFVNSAALAFTNNDYPNASGNPRDVTFQGSANVTLPAALTANRDLTITSGTVVITTFTLSVGRNFVNNSAYTTSTGSVTLTGTFAGSAGNVSGTGTFENLTTSAAAITITLTSNITFINIGPTTNSVLTIGSGSTLALSTFTLTTPGDIVNNSTAGSITNGTGGTIIMNGSVTQNFTIVDGQNNTLSNFTINKLTGSILNLKTASNSLGTMGTFTFTNNFNFVGGQLETNYNNIVIGAAHGTTANIGGPINRNNTGGSTGTFTLSNTAHGVIFGGTGQINIPVVNASTLMTNEFSLLTAIGSNLTVTAGTLKTSSLNLVNGNVLVYGGGALIMNGSTVSITGNMSVGFADNTVGTITGTSNVTVSGAVTFTGTSLTSAIDLTTGATPGNLTVTGALTGGTGGGTGVLKANTLSVGTLTQNATVITTTLDLIVGVGGTNSAAALNVGRNFQSTGAVVFGAGAIAIPGTFTALNTVTTGAGIVTVTGATSITGLLSLGTGAVHFIGATTLTGGSTTSGAASLRIDGAATVGAAMIDNGNASTFIFNNNTTITGNVTLTAASTITFGSPAASGILNSTLNGILSMTSPIAGALTIQTTDATNYHNLTISKNFTTVTGNNVGAVVLGASSTLKFNGSAAQTITLVNALTITGTGTVEFANTINTNQGVRDASITVATSILTVPNIVLTVGGVLNTNITLGAAGKITVVGGYFSTGSPTLTGGSYSLVFNNNSDWPLAVSSATTPTAYEWQAGIINLTLTTGYTGAVTYPSAKTLSGILTVAAGRTLQTATGPFDLTVTNGTASANVVKVDGIFSGAGTIIVTAAAATQTMSGTGTISNLTINYTSDVLFTMNGPSVLSGNFATAGGGANGTLTWGGTTVFTNVAGTTTFNNKTINLPTAGLSLTGSFTHTAGTIIFPTGNGNLTLLAAANTIQGGLTYTFGTNVFGSLVFAGTAAQTLTLLAPQTVLNVTINNAAGVTILANTFTATNLYLTSGVLTHNGLLSTTSITRRITATTNGQIATQPASGPTSLTYVGTTSGSTGPELLGVLTNLTMNSDIGSNPTITLASGTTILTGGTLVLSRGTLAVGTNLTFAVGTQTITRADGTLTGTPTFGGTVSLVYQNSTSITTGAEWSSPTAIGAVTIDCLGATVTLSQNSIIPTTTGGLLWVKFGTLDLAGYTLSVGAGSTNSGTITASGAGYLIYTATAAMGGTATSYPKIVVNGTGITVTTPAIATDTIKGDVVVIKGNFTVGNTTSLVITGNVDIQTTANAATDGFNDGTKLVQLAGNFSIVGLDVTPFSANPAIAQNTTGTLEFNGTAAQTITTRNRNTTGYLNNVKINNAAGVTLLTNVVLGDGTTLTLAKGILTTGAFNIQVGVAAAGTVTRTATGAVVSHINGTLNRWADSDPATATVVSNLFPMGTSDGKYRPATIAFTGTAAASQAQLITVNHTNTYPTGSVGIPLTNGGVTINKLAPLYWTIGVYNAGGTAFSTPATNPQITLGAGGVQFGDIQLTRAVYRLTNPLNTWLVPGTPGVSYYDVIGVPTVVHSGVQGWTTEAQELFAIGYTSNFAVANALRDTMVVAGTTTAYVKDLAASPAVFTGSLGTLTYSVVSKTPAVATASIAGSVLTVTAVTDGIDTVTVTATDVNNEQKTSAFVVTAKVRPTFTTPAGHQVTLAEGATTGNAFVFIATGTAGITYAMVPNTPALAWATFVPATATLTLLPTTGVAAGSPYAITIRATGANGLYADKVITVTITHPTSVESIEGVPTTFALKQNYPNPFNPSTAIQFGIPTSSNVKITVFNILGEEVAVLVNSRMSAGNYKVTFNASNLPSGLYLYRIQAENFTQVRKMLLTK